MQFTHPIRAIALVAVLNGCSTASTPVGAGSAPTLHGERAAIIQTVQSMFDAMATRDTVALRRLLAPEVVLFSTDERHSNAVPRVSTMETFVDSVANSREVLNERMYGPEVQVDGSIASLWTPYTFHRGGQLSHCGYDAFQLVRQDGQWRITAISYTLRQC